MKTGTCRLCGSSIDALLEFIQPTLVCITCGIAKFRSDVSDEGCFYTVSEATAFEAGCSTGDLHCLRHLSLCDSTKKSAKLRYLRGEIWYLRNFRRKQKLREALGIRLKDVHPDIRVHLLGDYLSELTVSKTSLEEVVVYKDVIEQATEIIQECPRAHPKAALDFCLMFPDGGPEGFQEMKEKVKKVFLLEGRRILHGLTKNERALLKNGPLEDVLDEFSAWESKQMIKNYLMRWFSESTADKIMNDRGWTEFEWANGSEDRVAAELIEFWKEKEQRREKLTNALRKRRLAMPEKSINCEDYMNGVQDLTVKEVVATVGLVRELRAMGIEEGSTKWTTGHQTLFQSLREEKMGYTMSIQMAKEAAMKAIEPEQDSDEDEDDVDEDEE